MKTNFILTTLIVLLICGFPLITHAQTFDGEREGLYLGTSGYLTVLGGADRSDREDFSGFSISGKIGYGMSDQLTIYMASSFPGYGPSLGVMFTPSSSDLYFHALLSYLNIGWNTSASILGGAGYMLRDNVSLELMLGTHHSLEGRGRSDYVVIALGFNIHIY